MCALQTAAIMSVYINDVWSDQTYLGYIYTCAQPWLLSSQLNHPKKKALLLELFFSILSLSCLSLLLQGPVWVRPLVQLTRLPPTIWFSIHLRTTQRRHTLYTTADLQQREHKKNCATQPKGKNHRHMGSYSLASHHTFVMCLIKTYSAKCVSHPKNAT